MNPVPETEVVASLGQSSRHVLDVVVSADAAVQLVQEPAGAVGHANIGQKLIELLTAEGLADSETALVKVVALNDTETFKYRFTNPRYPEKRPALPPLSVTVDFSEQVTVDDQGNMTAVYTPHLSVSPEVRQAVKP